MLAKYLNDSKAKSIVEDIQAQAPELKKSYTEGDWAIGQATLAKIGTALKSLEPLIPEKDQEVLKQMISDSNKLISKRIELSLVIGGEIAAIKKITGKKIIIKN